MNGVVEVPLADGGSVLVEVTMPTARSSAAGAAVGRLRFRRSQSRLRRWWPASVRSPGR